MTGSFFVGGGNQYIQLVCRGFCTVNCRPSVRQLPTFPHKGPGFEPPTSEVGGECVTTSRLSKTTLQ